MILEVCVDSTASALAAKRGGADRLELCADLIVGGTTPSLALVRQVKAETGLPVRALLRPRFGDFCYDRYELAQMEQLAAELVAAGADGIVTGALTPEGDLDTAALRPIYAAARRAAREAGRPAACTLHRAFDVCRDPFAALEAAKELQLATILTSGQAASAPQGASLLHQLVQAAGNDIEILVGAGVGPANLPDLAAQTGARAFHLSGKKVLDSRMVFRREGVPMGLPGSPSLTSGRPMKPLSGKYERFWIRLHKKRSSPRRRASFCVDPYNNLRLSGEAGSWEAAAGWEWCIFPSRAGWTPWPPRPRF